MGYEYEFRLVVENVHNFDAMFESIGETVFNRRIVYLKPNFRYRNRCLEIKSILKIEMVYHDNQWFKWVLSKETPYAKWSLATHKQFSDQVGNFQCPFKIENRKEIYLDEHAKIYTFRAENGMYRLVFEWEYGVFEKRLNSLPTDYLLNCLSKYRNIYKRFCFFPPCPYTLDETLMRKSVKCIPDLIYSDDCLVAHKWDGIYGLIYSYSDYIKEKWESGDVKVNFNTSLGDGIVFSAEKLADSVIILIDVTQVQGYSIASWCRRAIFLDYLPQLKLPEGYRVQCYYFSVFQLPTPEFETDGVIFHDTEQDKVFKVKENHSLDVVYMNGYFYTQKFRFKAENKKTLINGGIYEISVLDGQVIRKRKDRMTGNSWEQIENILSEGCDWKGPVFESIPEVSHKKRKYNTKKQRNKK